MTYKTQQVAVPAFLKKRLQAFRVKRDKVQYYLIKDLLTDEVHKLQDWQFFILEILPGCGDYSKLSSVFKDRFGKTIHETELEQVFRLVSNKKLFALSALGNPLLAEFSKQQSAKLDRVTTEKQKKQEEEIKLKEIKQSSVDVAALPPGIIEVVGFDEGVKSKGWLLFNPQNFVKLLNVILSPLKQSVYVLPFLFLTALYLNWKYFAYIEQDLTILFHGINIVSHTITSLLTVNLFTTFLVLMVAQQYRGTVKGIGIVFYFGFFPRFCPYVGNGNQFSYRERIWLHAAPLLLRIAFFSIASLLWFQTRGYHNLIAEFSLTVMMISSLSFIFTANPLVKGNGYHLVSTILNEPNLRKKAYAALLSKIKGNVHHQINQNMLAAYALASTVFMFLIFGIILFLVGRFLKMQFGGAGLFITLLIAGVFIYKMVATFRKISKSHDRAIQFQRWRERTLVSKGDEVVLEDKGASRIRQAKLAMLVMFIIVLFLPYQYELSGSFVILPLQQQEITSEISGIVNAVHFNSGDLIKKGSEIASLSHNDALAQANVYNAKIKEQQAVIEELKSRPLPEDIKLAEDALQLEITKSEFSEAKFKRYQKLYDDNVISYEELEDSKRQYEIDSDKVTLEKTNLELVKSGPTPDQFAAAEAKLQSLVEQRDFYLQQIEMSRFKMPFDGHLVTMHLDKKIGSYLNKGEPLALVENSRVVLAQLSIPEVDAGYVEIGSRVRIRLRSHHNKELYGKVSYINPAVVDEELGKVIHVTTNLSNDDGILKTGMTGNAKISSQTLPVWEILTRAMLRFYSVELWSWLP